jgi:protein-S-isoprenylcysteine O-methyltransferase Ste14
VAASIGRRGATLARAVSLLFVLARAVTYSTLFIGLMLVFIPARVLGWSGLTAPGSFRFAQWVGLAVAAGGGALALWCILTFALVGRGTPAPFDPPRRLVVRGPYRFVRNPMYLGAAAALGGAALSSQSVALTAYAAAFLLLMHGFVVVYEEPTLRVTFGGDYDLYCRDVRRWRPRL